MHMDPNALIVQHMLDRQAELATLRAELQQARGERDAYEAEVARLRALVPTEDEQ